MRADQAGDDMRVSLLSPDAGAWREALRTLAHDVYHLPEYASLAASHDGGEPVALLAEEQGRALLVPLLLRTIAEAPAVLGREAHDATSPYGFPGPITGPGTEGAGEFVARAMPRAIELLRSRGIVSVFVRLHPLIPFPTGPLADAGVLVHHGSTVAIDLGATPDELLVQIQKAHRRCIRMVQRLDHRMILVDTPAGIDDFLDIYRENMERVHASEYYFFPRAYFERMFARLGSRVHLAFLELEGERVCVDLLTEVGGIIECHLGATRTAHLPISPSIALAHYECLWAKERGNRLLHLGGGVGGREDSLFAFKAKFSKLRFPFSTWRLIVEPRSYDALVEQWARQTGLEHEPQIDFFPAYRKPVAG